jgi:hypothetical protein
MRVITWIKDRCRRLRRPLAVSLRHSRILRQGQGHALSVRRGEPVDGDGAPLPWFTYPAIEYLRQLDFSQSSVFEFGTGGSTLFWCRRAARVVGVEHDAAWHERVRRRLPANGELVLAPAPADYAQALDRRPENFDVIVVDGIERRACCAAALRKLAPGGLVILDNSDWHHRCAQLLREGGLLEVDMSGFGPINDYTWTTSLFFHREFRLPPAGPRQPMHGVGGLGHIEEPAE